MRAHTDECAAGCGRCICGAEGTEREERKTLELLGTTLAGEAQLRAKTLLGRPVEASDLAAVAAAFAAAMPRRRDVW